MSETLYKVLNSDGTCFQEPKWSLPVNGEPGKWMPPCEGVYYVSKSDHLLVGVGPAIFSVEVKGPVVWDRHGQAVVSSARLLKQLQWDDRIARLFACDCAESVLHLTGADRSICEKSIHIARLFSFGLVDADELAAASDASWAASLAAAAELKFGTECTASAAACAAAWAAKASTWDAVRSSAWDSAWAAALDAWEAARNAVRAADRDHTWGARNAAYASARAAQTKRLTAYLEGKINIKEIILRILPF